MLAPRGPECLDIHESHFHYITQFNTGFWIGVRQLLQCLAFFTVQFSHPYMTTGKTIALTKWTFVGKGMSLFLNILSRFSSVQSLSGLRLFATPWIAARQDSLSITNSRSSPRLTSIESMMPSSHLILDHPFFLLSPISPSIKLFSNETTLRMRWPKYWSFSFSIISSKKNPRVDLLQNGLIGSPCSPRDPQESSPTPQFKHINSLVLSLLHNPTLTSIHDHKKNHSLD